MKLRRCVAALAGLAALTAAGCGGSGESAGTAASGGSGPAACEPARAGERVTLDFTAFTPGYDKVVALWNRQNPDIQVRYNAAPHGLEGTYQNYFNQLKAGTAPDLGFVEYSPLPSYRVQDGLYDISSCAGIAESEREFIPWTWQQMTLGTDAVYGIPHDVSPMGVYYRRDLFERAGIAIPETWDEYYEAAKKVRAAGGYITNFPAEASALLAGLADQTGGRWFATEGAAWRVDLQDEATRRVAAYWQRMLDERLVSNYVAFGDEMNKALQSDRLWGSIAASWGSSFLRMGAPKTAGKWTVRLLPQWAPGDAASGSWGGGGIAVFKTTRHPAEAARFAHWILTDPEALALNNRQAGVYPATVSALQDIPFLQEPDPFFGDERIWEVFEESASNLEYDWLWGPTMVATDAALTDGVTAAIQGRGTLERALATAQQKTVDAMTAQSIELVE